MVGQLCSVCRERLPDRPAPFATARGSRPDCDRKPSRVRKRLRLAPGLAERRRSPQPNRDAAHLKPGREVDARLNMATAG
jgi:hypothetical protein